MDVDLSDMKPLHVPARFRAGGHLPRLLWMLMLLLLSVGAQAQSPLQHLTAGDRAEIAAYRLDTDVLARLQAVVAESHSLHIRKSSLDMRRVHSIDDMARQLAAVDPRITPLLARHGFSPHQFVVANLALVATAISVSAKRQAPGRFADTPNMRFYERHEAQVQRLLQSASRP